ncbi:MAG: PDDEXK nuclease domain-containing protein [Paludibacteraceae bacterium]|nr:PDDEXK nuclease domain-containing protein [Paludibacteraceae bacterium]
MSNKEFLNGNKEAMSVANERLYQDACDIIDSAQHYAYHAVNETLVKRNWLLGLRIQYEVLNGQRAEYGEEVVKELAKKLTEKYGSGYKQANLYHFISFYKLFPEIFYATSRESESEKIFYALSRKSEEKETTDLFQTLKSTSPIRLSWTHFRILLQESNNDARNWYASEAAKEMWSTRTLQRNISSQYYHRLLQSQDKTIVHDEMSDLVKPLQDKLEYLKNPVVAEFLGFKNNTNYTESELEQSIIDHLVSFIMELGKGFAFVDRQKHIHTEKEDYYIDLVFYNYHLRCFVLIDLKTTKLSYQDVGQMDMYVKMYDDLVRPDGHNPTIGILLCSDTDEDVAHYSVLNGNDQLYAAKYLTYMPTAEELRREIEQQKEFFRIQNGK